MKWPKNIGLKMWISSIRQMAGSGILVLAVLVAAMGPGHAIDQDLELMYPFSVNEDPVSFNWIGKGKNKSIPMQRRAVAQGTNQNWYFGKLDLSFDPENKYFGVCKKSEDGSHRLELRDNASTAILIIYGTTKSVKSRRKIYLKIYGNPKRFSDLDVQLKKTANSSLDVMLFVLRNKAGEPMPIVLLVDEIPGFRGDIAKSSVQGWLNGGWFGVRDAAPNCNGTGEQTVAKIINKQNIDNDKEQSPISEEKPELDQPKQTAEKSSLRLYMVNGRGKKINVHARTKVILLEGECENLSGASAKKRVWVKFNQDHLVTRQAGNPLCIMVKKQHNRETSCGTRYVYEENYKSGSLNIPSKDLIPANCASPAFKFAVYVGKRKKLVPSAEIYSLISRELKNSKNLNFEHDNKPLAYKGEKEPLFLVLPKYFVFENKIKCKRKKGVCYLKAKQKKYIPLKNFQIKLLKEGGKKPAINCVPMFEISRDLVRDRQACGERDDICSIELEIANYSAGKYQPMDKQGYVVGDMKIAFDKISGGRACRLAAGSKETIELEELSKNNIVTRKVMPDGIGLIALHIAMPNRPGRASLFHRIVFSAIAKVYKGSRDNTVRLKKPRRRYWNGRRVKFQQINNENMLKQVIRQESRRDKSQGGRIPYAIDDIEKRIISQKTVILIAGESFDHENGQCVFNEGEVGDSHAFIIALNLADLDEVKVKEMSKDLDKNGIMQCADDGNSGTGQIIKYALDPDYFFQGKTLEQKATRLAKIIEDQIGVWLSRKSAQQD